MESNMANPVKKNDLSAYHFSEKARNAIANLKLEGIKVDDAMLKEFKQIDLGHVSPEQYIKGIKEKYRNL